MGTTLEESFYFSDLFRIKTIEHYDLEKGIVQNNFYMALDGEWQLEMGET